MYLEQDINEAVEDLKIFFSVMSYECTQRGWSYYTSDEESESYEELKAASLRFFKSIPIATAGNDTAIYGAIENVKFRFWHDVLHLENDIDFSHAGELKIVNKHAEAAEEYGLSQLAKDILLIDTKGQVDYYYKHRRFVTNQETFIHTYLNQGRTCAMALK
jgi:hypothetical protein